jgi:hypothetical protein
MASTMRRTFTLEIFLLAFLSVGIASAQKIYVVVQGGSSSYASLSFGSLGAGGGDHHWKLGPIVGAGVRLKTSSSFSLDGTVEYSSHPYKPDEWDKVPVKGDPRNTIVEINAVARPNLHLAETVWFSFVFGPGYWFQSIDEVTWEGQPTWKRPRQSASGVGFLLGMGFASEVARRWDLSLDGTLRCRAYVTPVLQLGLAYRIN